MPEKEQQKNVQRTFSEHELDLLADLVAERVVERTQTQLINGAGKLVWEGIRRLVVTGIVALFAIDQIRGWLK